MGGNFIKAPVLSSPKTKMESDQVSDVLGKCQELMFSLVCQRPYDFSFDHLSLSALYFAFHILGSSFIQFVSATEQTCQALNEHELQPLTP